MHRLSRSTVNRAQISYLSILSSFDGQCTVGHLIIAHSGCIMKKKAILDNSSNVLPFWFVAVLSTLQLIVLAAQRYSIVLLTVAVVIRPVVEYASPVWHYACAITRAETISWNQFKNQHYDVQFYQWCVIL